MISSADAPVAVEVKRISVIVSFNPASKRYVTADSVV